MKQFPLAAFLALAGATIAAFFIVQHLKVSTPLIAGVPQPFPSVIDPLNGRTCYDRTLRQQVNYRVTTISFALFHESDTVDVYIVDQGGKHVATLASDRFMQGLPHPLPVVYTWDGREQDGAIAPAGNYYIEVDLIHQGRRVTISNNSGPLPVTVKPDTQSGCP